MTEAEALPCIQQARELDELNTAEDDYTRACQRGDGATVLASQRSRITAMCSAFFHCHGRRPVLRNGVWI